MTEQKQNLKSKIFNFIFMLLGHSRVRNQILTLEEKESIRLLKNGYLSEVGWWRSFKENTSLTKNNSPLPWVTYSFLDFIDKRLNNDMILFEYGSGNSTFYYSQKVGFVESVEHDKNWFDKVNPKMLANVMLHYRDLDETNKYEKSIVENNVKYDIIIIDGRKRNNCIDYALQAIKDNGVIVLDDSERTQYLNGKKELFNKGYRELNFWGISPGFIHYNKCTSIFYKSDNILLI